MPRVFAKNLERGKAILQNEGERHPAKLDFGDRFSYALSWVLGEPLLSKGDDFPCTDIVPAWHPSPSRR